MTVHIYRQSQVVVYTPRTYAGLYLPECATALEKALLVKRTRRSGHAGTGAGLRQVLDDRTVGDSGTMFRHSNYHSGRSMPPTTTNLCTASLIRVTSYIPRHCRQREPQYLLRVACVVYMIIFTHQQQLHGT